MSNLPQPRVDLSARAPQISPCTDQQFVALLDAYRSHGGLARMQEVATRFEGPRATGLARHATDT